MILGIDISGASHLPGLPWSGWYSAGARFAFVGWTVGLQMRPHTDAHYNEALAGLLWPMEYHALTPLDNGKAQALYFVSHFRRGWRGPAAVDVETEGINRALLTEFCDAYDAATDRPLVIYTSAHAWESLIGREARRFEEYMLWNADWGTGEITSKPTQALMWVPDIWGTGRAKGTWFWQFAGDNGRLQPYAGKVDLDYWTGDMIGLAQLILAHGDGPMDDAQILAITAAANEIDAAQKAGQAAIGQADAALISATSLVAVSRAALINAVAADLRTTKAMAAIRAALVPKPPPPPPPPPPKHTMATMSNQQVINLFAKAVGLPVLEAQLTTAQKTTLYMQRLALYLGPAVEDMPTLTAAQRASVIAALG